MRFVRHLGIAMSGLFLLAAATILTSPAQAQTQALDFTGGSGANSGGNHTHGWAFTISVPVTVTQLGLFDQGNNGFVNSHQVGLWDNAGNLLTSTTIGSGLSGTAVVSGSGFGAFRYVDTASVVLASGTYVIGASYVNSDADTIRVSATSTTMTAGFAFVEGRTLQNSGFGFPSATTSGNRSFGPNLRIANAAAPEPGSLALILTSVAGSIAMRRRKCR
jgi:hypothetical protein